VLAPPQARTKPGSWACTPRSQRSRLFCMHALLGLEVQSKVRNEVPFLSRKIRPSVRTSALIISCSVVRILPAPPCACRCCEVTFSLDERVSNPRKGLKNFDCDILRCAPGAILSQIFARTACEFSVCPFRSPVTQSSNVAGMIKSPARKVIDAMTATIIVAAKLSKCVRF